MAFNLPSSRDKAFELLDMIVSNGARPIMVIDDPDEIVHELFTELLFSDRKDTVVLDYSEFIMNQAFSIEEMTRLSKKSYVIVENVKYLYGKSATAKILADFSQQMKEADTGVIFTGKRAALDMAEFIELAEDTVQYIIILDKESD